MVAVDKAPMWAVSCLKADYEAVPMAAWTVQGSPLGCVAWPGQCQRVPVEVLGDIANLGEMSDPVYPGRTETQTSPAIDQGTT
jgi:hypothetical protein